MASGYWINYLIYSNKQELDLFSLEIKEPMALKYLIYGDLAESALKGTK